MVVLHKRNSVRLFSILQFKQIVHCISKICFQDPVINIQGIYFIAHLKRPSYFILFNVFDITLLLVLRDFGEPYK